MGYSKSVRALFLGSAMLAGAGALPAVAEETECPAPYPQGKSEFIMAARSGEGETLKELAFCDYIDRREIEKAASVAAWNGHTGPVMDLLEILEDYGRLSDKKEMVVVSAAKAGRNGVVTAVLDTLDLEFADRGFDVTSAIREAYKGGHVGTVHIIMDEKYGLAESLRGDEYKKYRLTYAGKYGFEDEIRMALRSGITKDDISHAVGVAARFAQAGSLSVLWEESPLLPVNKQAIFSHAFADQAGYGSIEGMEALMAAGYFPSASHELMTETGKSESPETVDFVLSLFQGLPEFDSDFIMKRAVTVMYAGAAAGKSYPGYDPMPVMEHLEATGHVTQEVIDGALQEIANSKRSSSYDTHSVMNHLLDRASPDGMGAAILATMESGKGNIQDYLKRALQDRVLGPDVAGNIILTALENEDYLMANYMKNTGYLEITTEQARDHIAARAAYKYGRADKDYKGMLAETVSGSINAGLSLQGRDKVVKYVAYHRDEHPGFEDGLNKLLEQGITPQARYWAIDRVANYDHGTKTLPGSAALTALLDDGGEAAAIENSMAAIEAYEQEDMERFTEALPGASRWAKGHILVSAVSDFLKEKFIEALLEEGVDQEAVELAYAAAPSGFIDSYAVRLLEERLPPVPVKHERNGYAPDIP